MNAGYSEVSVCLCVEDRFGIRQIQVGNQGQKRKLCGIKLPLHGAFVLRNGTSPCRAAFSTTSKQKWRNPPAGIKNVHNILKTQGPDPELPTAARCFTFDGVIGNDILVIPGSRP